MTKTVTFTTLLVLWGCTSSTPPSNVRAASLATEAADIEVIGLRDWTLGMVQDSLAKYAPGEDLASHACAAVLRSKLGFADASVNVRLNPARKKRVDIAVVEPGDSGWIRYLEPAPDSFPDVAGWETGLRVFLDHPGDFQTALQLYALLDETPELNERWISEPGDRLAAFLRGRTGEDLERALATLRDDQNWHNRVMAYAVLGRFPEDDRSWHALVDGLRDLSGPASSTASQTLSALVRESARPVDWSGQATSLRWLVNGTNLFGHTVLLKTLAATEIDPALAQEVLRDGGGITPYKLVSSRDDIRDAAVAFLRQISGEDFGRDPDAWIAWIATVRRSG